KFLALWIVFCGTVPVLAAIAQDFNSIRQAYRYATKSREQAFAFYEPLEHVSKSDSPLLIAYKGAGLTLLARYEKLAVRGPKVREAVQCIEQAVANDPQNAEIRLIRLSVQEHLPKFLKYNQNIEEDRQLIQEARTSITDDGLKAMIDGYFEEFK